MKFLAGRDKLLASARQPGVRYSRWESRFAYLALVPVVLYVILFFLFPVIMAFYCSLYDLSWGEFVGLQNYREAFFEDPRVWKSIRNTLVYALIRIPTTIVLGFLIANSLNTIRRGKGTLIFGFFAPHIANFVAFAAVFMYLYGNGGLFNAILQAIGLPPQPFIRSVRQALPSVALMDAWKHVGFDVIIILAALQNIPKDFYEAAIIEGASPWHLVRYITVPLLKPTFLYLLVMLSIWTLQVFEPIYVMTQGGPLDATRSIVFTIYQAAFANARIGYASALSFILLVIVFIITLVQMRAGITRWEY